MASKDQPALTLFTNPQSRARIVRWMLEECELPYETKVLEYGPPMKAPEILAMNPMGKVPILKAGDRVVTEVAAICCYLAELVPEKKLAPVSGAADRAEYFRWIFFLSGPLEAIMTARKIKHLDEPQSAGYGRYEDILASLSLAVSGKQYLCGESFTAADLLMSTYLRWYVSFGLLEPRTEFQEYFDRHLQRPASLRAHELDGPLEMPEQ